MATLVFDIETKALTEESTIDKTLSPANAAVLSLSVYDVERGKGTVYVVGEDIKHDINETWALKGAKESDVLSDFWQGTANYDVFVGFATRRFDVPFLIHRSISKNIRPDQRLLSSKHLTRQTLPFHIDLQDEFSFYGAMAAPLSLSELVALHNTEEKDLVFSYSDLKMLAETDSLKFALKLIKKLEATTELYSVWQQHLAPPHFLNTIEL